MGFHFACFFVIMSVRNSGLIGLLLFALGRVIDIPSMCWGGGRDAGFVFPCGSLVSWANLVRPKASIKKVSDTWTTHYRPYSVGNVPVRLRTAVES